MRSDIVFGYCFFWRFFFDLNKRKKMSAVKVCTVQQMLTLEKLETDLEKNIH
jgi:hypothetical protein